MRERRRVRAAVGRGVGPADREEHVRREALEKMRRLMDALLERLTQVRRSSPPPPPTVPRPAPRRHRAPLSCGGGARSPTTCCSARARKRAMHAAEGFDGDELRTTKYEIEQLEVRQRKQKKVLVKVAKMAVNAEGEHAPARRAPRCPRDLGRAPRFLVASAETLLAECAAARKKIREHHLLSVPTREVSRVGTSCLRAATPSTGTCARRRWRRGGSAACASSPPPTAARSTHARSGWTGADPIHGKNPRCPWA